MIINADSQQVYRDLPILTARPTPAEEAELPHKLYGFVGSDEHFSAGKWLRYAKMEIDWVREQGATPIVVGGTGLYLRALMQGIAEIPDIDISIRDQAESDYEAMGKEAFAERLRHIDPPFFERLNVVDKQRLLRAYSVWLGTAKTLTCWQQQAVTPPYAADQFHVQKIMPPREVLYARCNARFLQMIEAGAVEEVRSSLPIRGRVGVGAFSADSSQLCPPPNLPPMEGGIMNIIGVKQILMHLQGFIALESAVTLAQQATRNYAKRQITWFKNQLSSSN